MAETLIVRGAGGALFEMDVPTETHALEAWNERLAKGELVVVTDPVEWVEVQGAMKLQLVPCVEDESSDDGESTDEPADDAEPTDEPAEAAEPRRGRGGRKAAADAEVAATEE